MVDLLLEPLSYGFMVRGMIAAILVGVVSALVGSFVVLRGMAFLGDALAHAILPGVAVGYITGGGDQGALFWWGLATAGVTSLGIGALTRATRIKNDTAIGVLFAGMFALGIALISASGSYAVDLSHFLFGNVLGVSASDLLVTGITAGIVILLVIGLYKEFMVIAFDPVLAKTLRLPVRFLENLLLLLIAVTIVVALQTVGIALMVAMLVTPAAGAYLVTRRLWAMMALASLIAGISGIAGLYLSFYTSVASGAAIVLTSTALFLLIWVWTALRHRS